MTTTANELFGAYIGEDQQDEFETLRNDPLMKSAAHYQIASGWTSDQMLNRVCDFSSSFCQQWIDHGRPAPSMIGLPARALIAAVIDIEESAS